MGAFSIWHWLVVLLVVVLLFGSKKLRNLGGDLGTAVRGFKKGMSGEDAKDEQATLSSSSPPPDENGKDK